MAVSDITILIVAGYLISIAVRTEDKFIGNLMMFLTSLTTLIVLTGNEAIISALLILITLGNLILGVFTAQRRH